MLETVRSIAIIGAGASGAAAAAALKAEDYFDTIRVFERRETPGGTWIYDSDPAEMPLYPGELPSAIDRPLSIPDKLPARKAPSKQHRYETTPIYEELTTNVPDIAMSFTDRSFAYGPFAPHHIPKQYIQDYFSWHRTDSFLVLNTTVEDLTRLSNDRWRLVLRRRDLGKQLDEWWQEEFDAVILANGHYSIPYVPQVSGLAEYMHIFPGRVEHSKTYRTPKAYAGQSVLVIGNSASGCDIVRQLLSSSEVSRPIYNSIRSKGRCDGLNPLPRVIWKPVISRFESNGDVIFEDGTILQRLDKIIYCTGYKVSYPFWSSSRNGRALYDYQADRIINNFQHTFVQDFQTLAFIGYPRVLTFRSFEYQAIAIARLWSGRSSRPLPPIDEQKIWETHRGELTLREHRKFHQIEWDTGETIDWFRWLFEFAGLPQIEGKGRYPPILGQETRWAIEHIRKYPSQEAPGCGQLPIASTDQDWELVEHEPDTLYYI